MASAELERADAATDEIEPFIDGVMSECCGALILRIRLSGGGWYECRSCGEVLT